MVSLYLAAVLTRKSLTNRLETNPLVRYCFDYVVHILIASPGHHYLDHPLTGSFRTCSRISFGVSFRRLDDDDEDVLRLDADIAR